MRLLHKILIAMLATTSLALILNALIVRYTLAGG